MKLGDKIKITDFGLRHFDPEFGGTKLLDIEPKDFENYLNVFATQYFEKPDQRMIDDKLVRVNILDGYAPFCKLLVMKNITQCKTGVIPLTTDIYPFIRHGYSARNKEELPVMSRWVHLPPGINAPRATYTLTVLYSKEQIDKEAKATYNKKVKSDDVDSIGLEPPAPFDADWGAVAILGQMTPKEEPMKPITMLRNALGVEEGGSGVTLDKEAYLRSVEFWKENITVK